MNARRTLVEWRMISMLFAGLWVIGCSANEPIKAFMQMDQLESELQRGVSTKMDVQRVLGPSTGQGNALLPSDPTPRELWLYQDTKVTNIENRPGGVIQMYWRQQFLVVFFENEVFDGFMWYSNAGTVDGQGHYRLP